MDRLDDIWKNTFNDAELIEAQGALPSNNVWEGIAAAVEPKKDDKPFFWWILGGALVLLTSLGLYSMLNNQNAIVSSNHPEANLTELARKNSETLDSENIGALVEVSQSKLINTTELKSEAKNTASEADQQIISERSDAVVKSSASKFTQELKYSESSALKSPVRFASLAEKSHDLTQTSSLEKRASTNSKRSDVTALLASQVGVPPANLNASSAFLNTYIPSAALPRNDTKIVARESLELLESLAATLIFGETKVSLSERIFPVIDPAKQSRINTTFEVGAMQWNHRVNDALSNDLSPFDFNFEDALGWYASLGFAYALNQSIEIFSGLEYGQVQVQSGHNSTLTYSLDDELLDQASNNYALNLASPYGFMASEFKFSRTDALSGSAENILVDFHSKHQIQNIRVPLGMRFKILKFNTWKISAKGGFAINRIISLKNTPSDIVIHNTALSFDYGSATFGEQNIQAWHGDAFSGLEISKQIRQNLSLFLGGELSQGLSPIFKQDNYETKISRRYFSLGSALTF